MTLLHCLLDADRAVVLSDTRLSMDGRIHGETDKILALPRLGLVVAGSGTRCQQIELERQLLEGKAHVGNLDQLVSELSEQCRRLPHNDRGRVVLVVGFQGSRVRALALENSEADFAVRELQPGDYRWPTVPAVVLPSASARALAPATAPPRTRKHYAPLESWPQRMVASCAYAKAQCRVWPVACGGSLVGAFLEHGDITLKRLGSL